MSCGACDRQDGQDGGRGVTRVCNSLIFIEPKAAYMQERCLKTRRGPAYNALPPKLEGIRLNLLVRRCRRSEHLRRKAVAFMQGRSLRDLFGDSRMDQDINAVHSRSQRAHLVRG